MDLLALITLFLPLQVKHWFLIYVVEVGHAASRASRRCWPLWLFVYAASELSFTAGLLHLSHHCLYPLIFEAGLILIACLIERRSRMRSLFRSTVYVETATTVLYLCIALLPFCKE